MRLLFWNIMHGGGKRAPAITAQILAWAPDLVALAEFRATPASRSIAAALAERGLNQQVTTAHADEPARNGLLIAARDPLATVTVAASPLPAHRWLMVRVKGAAPFAVGVMHIPNKHTGLKYPYHDRVLALAENWHDGRPALLIGDTNSGIAEIDEEAPAFGPKEERFMRGMAAHGWPDVFRVLHGDQRAYTWYSPNGKNGFRLDQAFVNTALITRVTAFDYVWADVASRRLSDHAAILLDLKI